MRWRRRKEHAQDLERELRSDLELEAAEQAENGLSAEQARYAARRVFGNTTLVKEEVREVWGWTRWDILIQDVRYSLRMLRKSPGFAATAILTLALGIGASTAVFTVVDSIVLKPLTYRDSGNLVVAWERVRFLSSDPVGPNPRHVDLWRKRATSFGGLTLLRQGASGLTLGTEHPHMVGTVSSFPNLFEVLQVGPLLGRGFLPEDGVKGRDNVAILTYPLWQSWFGGDPNVVGKTIRLGDIPRQVIGVLPAGFHFPNKNALRAFRSKQPASSVPEPAIFVPAALDLSQFGWNGDYGNWIALARLKPGIGVRRAEAELASLEAQIEHEIPANQSVLAPGTLGASVEPMQEAVVGESKTGLWLLMAAVIGLMLIACVNLANAQLGRTLSRHREAAVRTALGAAKWRLVWSSLAENLLLGAVGGMAGVLLAGAGLNLFRRYSPVDLPRLSEVHLNVTVLVFSVVLTLGSSVLFGILPAVKLLRTDPQACLQQSNSRALGTRQSRRLRAWLIGLQVFGCTVLLLVTGLFSKSLLHLIHQEKGFETGQVAIAEVNLPGKTYPSDQSRTAFDDAVLQNLRAIPGVQTAGLVSAMPLEGESWIEDLHRADRRNQEAPLINLRWVSPGYFETMRERLVAGRFFEERDRNLSSIVLSEGEAKALWQNENPIGAQVKLRRRTYTVIGVVADSRSTSLKSPPAKTAYLDYKDQPPYATFFMARGVLPTEALVSSVRQAIWKHAPDVTIARVKALDSQLSDSLATERFQTSVLISFGGAALLLAMLGIYGVLSYSIVTRKQEIGVRMALGATRRKIYSLTLGEAGTPVFTGLGAGLIASILAGRMIQKLLYGIQAVDPSVIVIVAALFLAAAASAALVPARRAASVDPMEALRSE
jgi:predicted permease